MNVCEVLSLSVSLSFLLFFLNCSFGPRKRCHLFPQIAESYGDLTSNKEGTVICEIDGWVLGGVLFWGAGDGMLHAAMQFEVLVQVLFWIAACGAV